MINSQNIPINLKTQENDEYIMDSNVQNNI